MCPLLAAAGMGKRSPSPACSPAAAWRCVPGVHGALRADSQVTCSRECSLHACWQKTSPRLARNLLFKHLNPTQLIRAERGKGEQPQAAQRTDGGNSHPPRADVLRKQFGNQGGLSQLQPRRAFEKSPVGKLPPRRMVQV